MNGQAFQTLHEPAGHDESLEASICTKTDRPPVSCSHTVAATRSTKGRTIMYVVNKWADELQPGEEASPTIPAQHSMIYVARGSASVNGQGIDADSAIYVEDFAHIKAGKDGATLWRWGIVPRHEPLSLLSGNGVDSA